MSAKWRRSLAWDDRVFPAWAWPLKAALRALSSIWLGVSLLVIVALYGALASVPLGLLALALTWAVYAATLLLAAAIGAVAASVPARAMAPRLGPTARAFVWLALLTGGAVVGAWAWVELAWPRLRYLEATGTGLRFFPEFVSSYSSITLRRLPLFEMTELEYYSWWPLRVVLLLFVVNMVVATVRRIEFTLPRLGVLMVHTGIVLIALGSIYYQGLKREGDVVLVAGPPGARGGITEGAPAHTFYDNTALALYVRQGGGWEQRPLRGVPRYNDYALDAAPGETAHAAARRSGSWNQHARSLSIDVPGTTLDRVDATVSMRIVGYASYAEGVTDWVRSEAFDAAPNPLRVVFLHSAIDPARRSDADQPTVSFVLLPAMPVNRVADNGVLGLEYTSGMSEARWSALTTPLPPNTLHAMLAERVGADGQVERSVHAVQPGSTFEIGGYRCTVSQLLQEPPFPIITPGYEGASSALAIVSVQPPQGEPTSSASASEPYERWVYHRYPELSQDILAPSADGRPTRRDPEPGLRLTYLDCDQAQVFFDDRPDGTTRAAVRARGGEIKILDADRVVLARSAEGVVDVRAGGLEVIGPQETGLAFVTTVRWDHAEPFERPVPTPEAEREARSIGTHDHAWLAVEVSAPPSVIAASSTPWSTVVWLPFTRYLGIEDDTRTVRLPDGQAIELAFGRRQHPLGFEVALLDFEMIPYDHGGPPRDYRSSVRVTPLPSGAAFEPFEHDVSLNSPLRAPFRAEGSGPVLSAVHRLAYGLNPHQLKFSQAGWDPTTWERTTPAVQAGQWDRQSVGFTILAVGNNPGIHVIALGGILMAIGIPWAFYVKPWMLKRRAARAAKAATSPTERNATQPAAHPKPTPKPPAEVMS